MQQPLKRVPHPSGVSILFDAKWHQYKMGNTRLRSVSKLLDKYFPFEEEKILALVSKKKQLPVHVIKEQWNRQALLGTNIHEFIECKLLNKPPPTFVLLMEKQKKDAKAAAAAAAKASDAEKRGQDSGAGGNEDGASKEAKSTVFSELLHGEEALYLPVAEAAVEKIQAAYEVVGVEQVVAAPDWGLAGTIDFVGVNKQDPKRILIGDWKTSGSVTSNFRFGSFETPSEGCLRHLPNAKFYRYAMQVIVYGEMIKKERYIEQGFFDNMLVAAYEKMHRRVAEGEGEESLAGQRAAAGGERKKKTAAQKKGALASSSASSPPVPTVKALLTAAHNGDYKLEYGIVQLSKTEEGAVAAEFKKVTEETVLPPDTREMNFNTLLQKVMIGE